MKRYFQTAWDDIRSGENIDIYLTLLVCLVLVVAGIVGIADFIVLASGILATLAILATSILGVRKAAQNLREALDKSGHRRRLKKHSQTGIDSGKISKAQTLDWMSVSLFKTLPMLHYGISECLRREGQVRILLVDPRNSDVLNALARSGYFFNDPEKMSRDISSILDSIENWRRTIPNCRLEIRLLRGQPPYRMHIVDRLHPTGHMYLRVFVAINSSDIPTLSLHADEDREWFEFFTDQFERFWNESIPVEGVLE